MGAVLIVFHRGDYVTMDLDRWVWVRIRSIRMNDKEIDALENSLVPVAEVILSETKDGESVDATKDIVEAINKQ